MANAAMETPAAYLLASQFYDEVRAIIEEIDEDHDYLAIELIKYAERILGNVGAAEAPFAAGRRQEHYQIAFGAICGCASACDIVRRLKLAPREHAEAAVKALSSLAGLVRPLAEEGMGIRSEMEKALLDDLFESLDEDDEEGWEEDGDDDETW